MSDRSDNYQGWCPLHETGGWCECHNFPVVETINDPMGMGLWRCDNNHSEIGLPAQDPSHAVCVRCRATLRWLQSGIFTPDNTPSKRNNT